MKTPEEKLKELVHQIVHSKSYLGMNPNEEEKFNDAIRQFKSEAQKEVAQKIIDWDKGEVTRYNFVSYAYKIMEEKP